VFIRHFIKQSYLYLIEFTIHKQGGVIAGLCGSGSEVSILHCMWSVWASFSLDVSACYYTHSGTHLKQTPLGPAIFPRGKEVSKVHVQN